MISCIICPKSCSGKPLRCLKVFLESDPNRTKMTRNAPDFMQIRMQT
jgi:hypothetical protein